MVQRGAGLKLGEAVGSLLQINIRVTIVTRSRCVVLVDGSDRDPEMKRAIQSMSRLFRNFSPNKQLK